MVVRLFVGNHKLAVQVVFVVTTCFGPRVVSYFPPFCIHREVLQANGCSVAYKFFCHLSCSAACKCKNEFTPDLLW